MRPRLYGVQSVDGFVRVRVAAPHSVSGVLAIGSDFSSKPRFQRGNQKYLQVLATADSS